MPFSRFILLPLCLGLAGGCISRTTDGRDIIIQGDNDAGDHGGGDQDDGDMGDSGGGDDDSCNVNSDCPVLACQNATICAPGADSTIQCAYEDHADDTPCDFANSGSADGICRSGECLDPDHIPCESNSGCETSQSCIGGECATPGGLGDSCDAGDSDLGDDNDCADPFVCKAGDFVCVGATGVSCTNEAECDDRCIGGVCAVPSELDGPCDSGDDADCESGLGCNGENLCRLADGEICANNSQCASTCIAGECTAPGTEGAGCDADDDADCAVGQCLFGACGTSINTDVLIIELAGHFSTTSPGATLTEVELYDASGALVSFATTDTDAYDSTDTGPPNNWTGALWGRSGLNDGDITYTGNGNGGTSSTIFFHNVAASPDTWARFAIFLAAPTDIARIRINLGSPERRIPRAVNVYRVASYDYATQVQSRNYAGLDLLWTITTEDTSAWRTAQWQELNYQ